MIAQQQERGRCDLLTGRVLIVRRSTDARSRSLSGRVDGTSYYYRASACNAAGCSDPRVRTGAITVQLPQAPGQAGPISGPGFDTDGSFLLSWPAASGTVTRYELQWKLLGGGIVWNNLYVGGSPQYQVSGFGNGDYRFRVRACNDDLCGTWSASKGVIVQISGGGGGGMPQ